MPASKLSNTQLWTWLAFATAVFGIVWLLSPILAPFLFAAILAYILDPLVERLTRRRVPRTLAVILVLLLVVALVAALALVVLPLFYKELRLLGEKLPAFLAWLNEHAAPWLKARFDIEFQLDVATVRELAGNVLSVNKDLAGQLLGSLKVGGLAVVGVLITTMLVPVVLFYLLRDWNVLLKRVDGLLPRHLHARVRTIVGEIDAVLAEFLRGQMLVIVVMTVFYVCALWLAQLQFALPIGIITGVLVFIPYIGALTGFVLGSIAALMQFDSLTGVAWVWLAFGVGQALEGTVVTPLLVGDRIGLHPVAVIFALLAFGQVFGFFGVLLALPASAALLVGLRHLRRAYLTSALYGPPDAT
ncbi:MAG: AI-2E family transporter [Proteobacteria bacterium]|nr:AI-2E family transporter [Pseudomonadota bacterium]